MDLMRVTDDIAGTTVQWDSFMWVRGAIVPELVVILDPATIGTADTTPYTFGLQNQG